MRKNEKNLVLEVERVKLVRKKCRLYSGFCRSCSSETDFVPLIEIKTLFEVSAEYFFPLLRQTRVHFENLPNGEIYLCVGSLMAYLNAKRNSSNIKLIEGGTG